MSDMVRYRFWEGPSGHIVGNELAWGQSSDSSWKGWFQMKR